MENEENRYAVYSALLEALKKDRAKTNVLPISGLGLVEMERHQSLVALFYKFYNLSDCNFDRNQYIP